jgi:hypothetical protein
MEVVVTGKNGSFVGTAIFRLEQVQIVNLFDEDFDKCCGIMQKSKVKIQIDYLEFLYKNKI